MKLFSTMPENWLQRQFFEEKLNNPLGFILLFLFAISYSILVIILGIKFSLIIWAGILAIPLMFVCMFNHQIGVSVMLVIGFLVQIIGKYTDIPVGTSMDALLYLMLLGLIVQQTLQKNWAFSKNPISNWVLIWVYANLFQVLNPWAESKLAWMYTVRSMALLILIYFVACNAFSSLAKIKGMIKFCLFLTLIATLWGLKQEYFGFNAAELRWLYADKERFQLIFQWSRLRIFSLLNDPTTYGIMMAYMSVFCFILATGPYRSWQRIVLLVAGIMMTMANAYTGTRTAFVLVPLGFVFYTLLNPNKNVLIATLLFMILGTGVIMKSTSNPVIYRIQSAFKPSEDESVQVRIRNQKFIQPFIQSHPIGAGLGSTGLWGRRFTPDSWLAKFPHDSGYVRIAVEQGWLGLLVYMIFLFVVLKQSVFYYIRVRNPEIKNLYLALSCSVYMLVVANYPQEAIVQLPTSLLFYIMLACIARLKDFDEAFQPTKPEEISIQE